MGRRRKGQDVNGWLVLDKAVGLTSTEAVSRVRRFFDARKAGHAGTLDPLASGLLPIALGEATKTVPVLMEGAKRYRFTIRWGEARATDDLEGPVEATSAARPSQADIEGQLPAFIGDIAQLPPRYSAVKINGERAYDLARRGENPEPKSRCVTVHDLKLIACPDRDHATLELACGKGTYVRSLARDLGKALGTYGAVSDLRRTGVSPFLEEDAISLEKLDLIGNSAAHQEALLPVATALDDIPALAVNEVEAARLRSGQPIRIIGRTVLTRNPPSSQSAGRHKGPAYAELVTGAQRQPVALGTVRAGEFRPSRVFNL